MELSAVERVLSDADHLVLVLAALPDREAVVAAAAVARFWADQSRDERVWLAIYVKLWGLHMMADLPLQDLRAGDVALFHGLVSRSDLNGKSARLVRWIEREGRWVAERASAGTGGTNQIKVRPHNLTATWRWRCERRVTIPNLHQIETTRSVSHLDSFSSQVPRPLACGLSQHSLINASGAHAVFKNVAETPAGDMGCHEICRSSSHLWPLTDAIGYFEVRVSGSSIGVTNGDHYRPSGRHGIHIGWRQTAYGYHSDDGSKWRNDERGGPSSDGFVIQGERFAEPFGSASPTTPALDVVGCGVDHRRRSIFFTKNGRLLGTAFENVPFNFIERQLHPTVTLHQPGDVCKFNFGAEPFLFDVLAYGRSEARYEPIVGGGRSSGPPTTVE